MATIYNNNNKQNTFNILLQNAGYFNVYAFQPIFEMYGSSSVLFGPIVITKSTPAITFTNINTQLIYGRTYNLPSASIINTNVKKNDGRNIILDILRFTIG